MEAHGEVERGGHGLAALEEPPEAVVVLRRHRDLREDRDPGLPGLGLVGPTPAGHAGYLGGIDVDGPVVAPAGSVVEDGERGFLVEQGELGLRQLVPPEAGGAGAAGAFGFGRGGVGELQQLGVALARRDRLEWLGRVARRVQQHDLAAQLAAVRREVFERVGGEADEGGGDGRVEAGRPRARVGEGVELGGAVDVEGEAVHAPTPPERAPRLQVDVLEAPGFELLGGPGGGVVEAGRAGQARPVHLGQPVQRLHHLAPVQALRADHGDGTLVDRLLLPVCGRSNEDERQQKRNEAEGGTEAHGPERQAANDERPEHRPGAFCQRRQLPEVAVRRIAASSGRPQVS